MATFFPRQTIEFRLEEPRAFRKLSVSLVEIAVLTGVVLRVYRAFVIILGTTSWWYIGTTITLAHLVLFAMLTAHLANYPLPRWRWRAPAFWAIEVAAEMAVSALLVAIRREPTGTVRAHWADWPGLLANTAFRRGVAILAWSLILALAVHIVRTRFMKKDEVQD